MSKTITMPYDEYLADLHNAKNEVYQKIVQPIEKLIAVQISSGRVAQGQIPNVFWEFEGSKDDAFEILCGILGKPSVSETITALRERMRL